MLKRIRKLSPGNLLGSGQENGKRGLFLLKWIRKNLSGSLWLGKKYVAFLLNRIRKNPSQHFAWLSKNKTVAD